MNSTNTALFDDKLNREKTYWLEKFAGELRTAGIPLDRKRPAVFNPERRSVTMRIDPETEARLREVCGDKEALMFTVLVAVLKICLHKYTGETDIIIGTAIHERFAEVASLNKVLALRDEVRPEQTVKQLLQAVKGTLSEAYANQKYPFERLVKQLNVEQAGNRASLFNVVVIQDATNNKEHVRHLMSDVTLIYSLGSGPVECTIEYNPDLFEAETIEIFGRHLQRILHGVLGDTDAEVSQLELLSGDERQQLLVEFNETQQEFRKHATIYRLFEEQVDQTPEHIAVSFGERQVTYQELNERANQLARKLRQEGIKPGALVGICLEHSIETLVAILGVLKAGGGYVPLDPRHPRVRLATILTDAGCVVLLTQQSLIEVFPSTTARVICLDSEWELFANESVANPAFAVTAGDLAYVIYTSGSTGAPKGVAINHRSLVNYTQWASEVYVQHETLAFPLYSSLSFDLTVTSIFTPLITGNRIIVYRQEGRESALFDILRDNEVGVLKLTPSHLALIKDDDHSASRIKRLIVGGEAFDTETARQVHESFRGAVEILNEYGPTEATVGCMLHQYDPESDRRAVVPIGKPAANTQIYILDEHLRPVAENVLGELYISGAGLATGYLNRDDLTEERFIANPFREGEKMYRSGDVARWLPGGVIEYVGRSDEQVKFHGYRVELNEIRSALNKHRQVRDSVIRLQRDAGGNEALVAYYVARQEVEPEQLREHLSAHILKETLPNFFVHLKRLPLTLNGKVNYAALPSLEEIKIQSRRAEYVAPHTEVEEIVAGIWATLLGVPQVSRYDNFFHLGGHSLLATQVVSRVRETLQVELTVRALFEHPTVDQFAADIETLSRNGLGYQIPPLTRANREVAPLSFAQQRLWFIDQLVPGGTFYNVSSAVRLQGRLDIAALERTITEVVRRHEVLRTSFRMVDGEPAQVVAPVQAIGLPITDLSALREEEREAKLRQLLFDFSAQPFNLSQDSLLRVGLVRLGEDIHAVMLVTHHIICDGWSMGVLIKEVATIYGAFSRGEASPLPELAVQYADFAVWQREWLQGAALEQELAYWRNQLSGAPPVLELPTDKPRPAVQSYRGASHAYQVSAEVSAGLKALSRSEGATLFMTLLAAFKILLSRYSGQTDIVVGTPIAGRNRVELEPLIGFFVNTLALRTHLASTLSFREVLRQVRETALEAYAHEHLPFEKIVEELNPERALSHTPLVQVVFGFQSLLEQQASDISELTMSALGNNSGTARFDVVQNMFETEQGLSGSLHLNTDLFDVETIKRMSAHFQRLLQSIVEHPEAPISELVLLSEEERQQQLVEWNDSSVSYARHRTLHELFTAQAAATPEAIALVYEEDQLSYRELNERSNQLARYLQTLGVGPESLVALCFERSLDLVVALLGVLKAGGAYLPLDPQYPQERLAFMVQDAGVSLLLTQTRLAAGIGEWAGEHVRVIELEREWEEISERSVENPAVTATADNLAYVIYTSGSTGQPKGTLITHYNVTRLLDSTAQHFAFSGADVWTLFHSYAFDFSVWEIWGALAYGGQLVVVPYGVSRSPHEFHWLLREHGVTVLNQTPSAFRQLSVVDAEASEAVRAELKLRLVIFGGEALEWQSLRGWFERHGDEQPQLINMYGITETTVHVTYREVSLSGLAEASVGSLIGEALDDLQLYLLDQQLELLPVGVWGELYVGGAGLARGYLKRPELTAQRFVPNPFEGSGGRLYRTGDVGRYRADGEIEYLGRADSQVKIRGFRIELGEIESVLGAHEQIREVVVMVREDVPGDQRVVAYLVVDEAIDNGQLRAYLKEKLPDYMVPAAFVTLEEMPLTQNGKVDRRALPAPDVARADASFGAPQTALQRWLAERWCDVLHLDSISIEEDFFELGGDSIKAAIIINRLQQEMEEIIHVVTIFDASSVAAFASYLEGQYPEAVQRMFGVSMKSTAESGVVTVAQVEQLRALTVEARHELQQLAGAAEIAGAARLQPALFVLSAPRSGSTLMRVMVGGHSRLFAPPELELLGYQDMGQRRAALTGRDKFWLEGAIRAVMQARDCSADEAESIIAEYEARSATTTEFYRDLQEWIGTGRMLVDKTPSYAMELEVLRRAEQEFEGARYLHLVRRPEAVINSYVEAHLEQIFPRFAHPYSGRAVAELVWAISQQNIMEFLREVSDERQHRVVFEELVAEPQRVLAGVSEFLGLEYEAGMSEPYRERAERMTDGVRAESKMLGDIKFHEHRGIEAGVGERWRKTAQGLEIGDVTKALAKSLGYVQQAEAKKLDTRKTLTPIRRVDETANDEQIEADVSVMSDQEVAAMLDSVLQ